jgi:hypothetical protein
MGLTLTQATSSKAITLISMNRIYGPRNTQALIAMYLEQADAMCGGKCTAETLGNLAIMAMRKFSHRSVASILMAIRDGMSYSDEDGKVYGVITWPKLSLWMDRHEESILGMVANESAVHKEAPGNLGKDYLDKQERGSDSYRVEKQSRLIDKLRAKLENK